MSARAVRWAVIVVCVGGIAGMIVSSIADSTDGALAFGLTTAAAAVALILVTSVTAQGPADREVAAAALEDRIVALVEAGADERAVRALVSQAVDLGRSQASGSGR
jgi:hypothetical protein